jgi:hypothetical protein
MEVAVALAIFVAAVLLLIIVYNRLKMHGGQRL